MEQAIRHIPPLDLDADPSSIDRAFEERLAELPITQHSIRFAGISHIVPANDRLDEHRMLLAADRHGL